jgi:hypothetical protein
MHSRRPNRSYLFVPLSLILSGKAAFSLKNALVLLKQYSDAGVVAGVFLAIANAFKVGSHSQMMAEVLHM